MTENGGRALTTVTSRGVPGPGAVRLLTYLAAAIAVMWITWPGSASDSAVAVNRIEVPVCLGLLALLPALIRRRYGPVGQGILPRAVRAGGYLTVLAFITAQAVQAREGQKLGVYFHDGGIVRSLILLAVSGYAIVILVVTSDGARLSRPTLAISTGAGALAALVLFACFSVDFKGVPLAWWILIWLALPSLLGFVVTRRAQQDEPGSIMVPSRQGGLAAICASGTAVLLLLTLTTVTVAVAPARVPLQQPAPPGHGGCETCDPNSTVIPPALRHEYWVGLSVTQACVGLDFALIVTPLLALFAGAAGVAAAKGSLRARPALTQGRPPA